MYGNVVRLLYLLIFKKENMYISDIEDEINKATQEGFKNDDFFAVSVLSYKNAIINNILATKTSSMQQQSYPSTAKLMTIEEAAKLGVL
jgi:hypothetical protein